MDVLCVCGKTPYRGPLKIVVIGANAAVILSMASKAISPITGKSKLTFGS
jgi:hypothetical protein